MKKVLHNLGVHMGVFFITLYRIFIRPFAWSSCRYEPSCSEYTKQAIKKYGLFKGSRMGALRIGRCHPFAQHDPYDPVE